jgi:hypothetical protein
MKRQEVSNAIDKLNADVSRLDSLHNRYLNDLPDDPNSQNTTRQIDTLMADTGRLRDGIKLSIQGLTDRARQARGDMQKQMVNQTESVRKKFVESINRFQQIEKAYRERTRQRMERQMRIGMLFTLMANKSNRMLHLRKSRRQSTIIKADKSFRRLYIPYRRIDKVNDFDTPRRGTIGIT